MKTITLSTGKIIYKEDICTNKGIENIAYEARLTFNEMKELYYILKNLKEE